MNTKQMTNILEQHSNKQLIVFNLFLIMASITGLVYACFMILGQTQLSIYAAIFGIFLSFIFLIIDLRSRIITRDYKKTKEHSSYEKRLIRNYFISYSFWYRFILTFSIVLFSLFAFYALQTDNGKTIAQNILFFGLLLSILLCIIIFPLSMRKLVLLRKKPNN